MKQLLRTFRRHRVALLVGAFAAAWTLTGETRSGDAIPPDGLIRRVVEQTTRTGLAIRATRELRAGTVSGKHLGWMQVETLVTPAGAFTWSVIEEGGSERTRNKVFRPLLESEAETWRDQTRDLSALTPRNYEFTPMSGAPAGTIAIRVTPRRADSRLVDGVLTVSGDGYPLRLEGRMAKSPSFWVKSITVVKRFARVGGVALPVTIESLADLRLFGQASFTMRYRYHEVNGRPVAPQAAAAPLDGPSQEILALHAAWPRP